MTEIAYAAMGAALIVGFILGVWARPFLLRLTKTHDPQEVSDFMNRVVNLEGAEERRRQNARMLHDAGRRTMRLDGGRPAKVHKMRRAKRRTIRAD